MVDNPGSPILMGGLPPPPFMPPLMGLPPPPFMPPPFMPGEMRPPPLGRLMSPPPNRYSPSIIDDHHRDRYSPDRGSGRYTPDSRYNMSPYETETDFSPPPSPGPHLNRHGSSRGGDYRNGRGSGSGYKAYSPPPQSDIRDRNKSKLKGNHYYSDESSSSDTDYN